jgi:hypothetical protein
MLEGEAQQVAGLQIVTQAFLDDGISAQTTLLEDEDFVNGVRTGTQVLRHAFFAQSSFFAPAPEKQAARTPAVD